MENNPNQGLLPPRVSYHTVCVILNIILRFYSTMKELRNDKQFPPKVAFFNQMKQQHIDDDLYNASKKLFDEKLAAGEWTNMSDYLKHYNLLDVEPLVEALKTCFDNYARFFKVDACSRLSLPSISFQAMYKMFDKSLPYVYTFNAIGDSLRQTFRDILTGGLTTVLHRLVLTILHKLYCSI